MIEETPEQAACRIYREQFSVRLTKALAAVSLSQNSMAKRLGGTYSQSTLNRVAAAKRSPDAYLVVLLAKELGCSAEWLLTGEGASGLKKRS
jgi:transcriptional regulator with XRE-family HTH domain